MDPFFTAFLEAVSRELAKGFSTILGERLKKAFRALTRLRKAEEKSIKTRLAAEERLMLKYEELVNENSELKLRVFELERIVEIHGIDVNSAFDQ